MCILKHNIIKQSFESAQAWTPHGYILRAHMNERTHTT
jgi:hypothetical protein